MYWRDDVLDQGYIQDAQYPQIPIDYVKHKISSQDEHTAANSLREQVITRRARPYVAEPGAPRSPSKAPAAQPRPPSSAPRFVATRA